VNQVYQIRGFDLSNMTLIEGDTGLIVVDPLLGIETASAALDLYYSIGHDGLSLPSSTHTLIQTTGAA